MSRPSFLADLPLARAAADYAAQLHEGQRRKSDQAAFILHPLEVAFLLHNRGFPEPVVAAAILHEALEGGGGDPRELRARFGDEIADLVAALTEDASIEAFAERKAALREQIDAYGGFAPAIDAADKVAKVREFRARAHNDPGMLSAQEGRARLEHYRATLTMLEGRDPTLPLVRQLRFELEALATLPPHGS
jgi:HD domain